MICALDGLDLQTLNIKKMKYNQLIIDSSESRTDLCNLGVKYPTDKTPYCIDHSASPNSSKHRHPYTAVYDFLFTNIRYFPITIAEIGILDNMSMKCWREYFPNALLYGYEYSKEYLDKAEKDNLANTKYFFMDVKSEKSIEEGLCKDKFDIIIEDSTHIFEDQIRVINVAHKFLKPNGIIVIEDLFKSVPNSEYIKAIKNVESYYKSATFVVADHTLKHSLGWDNDKLLILNRSHNVS
jgi:SAM-dependent methyltransferase